jgi:UDP-N-acetylmuramoylalanine--D-glutamate ligase
MANGLFFNKGKFEMNLLEQLKDNGSYIFGFGVTGKGVAKFFDAHKISYQVIEENNFHFQDFENLKIQYGVVSPGWKKDHPLILAAKSHGIIVISEIDLAWAMKEILYPEQAWVGVTGTNGKTTTIQMVESILQQSNLRSVACGNVGLTAIEALLTNPPYEILALELSSFQLDWSDKYELAAGAILNIAEDHLDWHGNFQNYLDAKMKITSHSKISILNRDDLLVFDTALKKNVEKVFYTLATPGPGEIGLVEEILVDRALVPDPAQAIACATLEDIQPLAPHNVSNALAAVGIARAIGIGEADTAVGLRNFKIDQHRLSLVGEFAGMKWVDDSKATNPHAAIAALRSFDNILWISGGLAKGAGMAEIAQVAAKRVKKAILIGTDQEIIKAALMKYAPEIEIIAIQSDLKDGDLGELIVKTALANKFDGATVLLAPACASMDQFENYKARGDAFAIAVRKLMTQVNL